MAAAQIFFKNDLVTVSGEITRPVNREDRLAWEASDLSKGMTDAGETKLQYPSYFRNARPDEVFSVDRGRARFRQGWGNPTSGWVKLIGIDGTVWHAKEKNVRIIK